MADVRVGVRIQAAIDGLAQVRQMVQSIDGLGVEGQSAARELDALTRELEEIARTQGLIQTFRQQKQALADVSREYAAAKQRSSELGKQLAQTAEPTKRQTQEFERARAATRNYAQAQQQAQLAVQQSRQALQQAGVSTQQLATAQRQLAQRSQEANTKLDALNTEVKQLASAKPAPDVTEKLRGGADRAGGAIRGVTQLLGAIGISVGLAQVIGQFTEAAKSATQFERALVAITGSAKEAEAAQQRLSSLADKYGTEIVGLEKAYISWRAAVEGTNLAGQESEDIFEAVVGTMGALGRSSADTEGALLALQQMVSKGTVSMEELRQQLGERLPGAFRLAADAMGVSTTELTKMVETGQVMADDLLPGLAKGLREAYNLDTVDRIETLGAAQGRLSNSTVELFRAIDDASGASSFFAGVLDSLAGYVRNAGEVWRSYAGDQDEATQEIVKAVDASERAALRLEAQAAAQEKLRVSAQDLKTKVEELADGYEAWREQQESGIEVAEAERAAREALIALYGDETAALDEVVRAAGERAEAARLEAERLGELASAAATYATQLRFEYEAREENTGAQTKALAAAEQEAQLKRDQYDASQALAEALETEAAAQDVARQAAEDNSERLAELAEAYAAAKARVEELEQAQADGIDVAAELIDARREEAAALALYNDAYADLVENLTRAAEAQRLSNDLAVRAYDAKIAEAEAAAKVAAAAGNEAAEQRALQEVKRLQAEQAEALAKAKRAEAEAAAELIPVLQAQAEADGEVTEAEREAIAAAQASAEAKGIEADVSAAVAEAKKAEAIATDRSTESKRRSTKASRESAEANREVADSARYQIESIEGAIPLWDAMSGKARQAIIDTGLFLGGVTKEAATASEGLQNLIDRFEVLGQGSAKYYSAGETSFGAYVEQLRQVQGQLQRAEGIQAALNERIADGSLRMQDVERWTDQVNTQMGYLGDETLAPLRSALEAARQELARMNQQTEDARLSLASLDAQIAEAKGLDERAEKLRLEAQLTRDLTDLQRQRDEAERAGNSELVRLIDEQIRKRRELYRIQEDNLKRGEDANKQERDHADRINQTLDDQIDKRADIADLEEDIADKAGRTATALDRQADASDRARQSIQSLDNSSISQLQRSIDALAKAMSDGIGRGAQQARSDIQALDAVQLRNLRGELSSLNKALTTDIAAGVRTALNELGRLNADLLGDLRRDLASLGGDLTDAIKSARRAADAPPPPRTDLAPTAWGLKSAREFGVDASAVTIARNDRALADYVMNMIRDLAQAGRDVQFGTEGDLGRTVTINLGGGDVRRIRAFDASNARELIAMLQALEDMYGTAAL